MIEKTTRRFGFTFKTILFSLPHDVRGCSQSQIISYKNIDTDQIKIIYRTPIIKFNQPIEKIFAGFNKTTRNEVNQSYKYSDLVIETDSQKYDKFYELYLEFEKNKGRLTYIPDFRSIYNKSKLFLAKYKESYVAAVLCYDDKKVLRANVICSSRLQTDNVDLKKIISLSGRRLIYEVCKFGKDSGYRFFDLGEINDDINSPVYSITRFKMNFGGELVNSIHYYKIYNPILKLLALLRRKQYF